MPICSYLVHPSVGAKDRVHERLSTIPGCTAFPAEKHDLIILVTETESDDAQYQLQERLHQLPEIECLALTFAHNEDVPLEESIHA